MSIHVDAKYRPFPFLEILQDIESEIIVEILLMIKIIF